MPGIGVPLVVAFQAEPAFARYMTELLSLTGGTVPDGFEGHERGSAAEVVPLVSAVPAAGPCLYP